MAHEMKAHVGGINTYRNAIAATTTITKPAKGAKHKSKLKGDAHSSCT